MKILVLQIEDRYDARIIELMKFNQRICNKNDFLEYKFQLKCSVDVPPYWAKVFEIAILLQKRKDIDYIIWLDSDAMLVNPSTLQNLLLENPNVSFFGSPDQPDWTSPFNAGVFVVKNNEHGKNIMEEWCKGFYQSNWKKEFNTWFCPCLWAGSDYEQGSFVKYIMTNPKLEPHISIQNFKVFQETNCNSISPETISVHLAGNLKNLNSAQRCYSLNQIKQRCFWKQCVSLIVIIVLLFVSMNVAKTIN